MFRNSKLFKGVSKLINGVSGNEVTPQDEVTPQNEDQSEDVIPKIDNTKTLERLAAQSQQEDKAQVKAGVKAYANKEYDEAIAHYQKAIEINPSEGSIYTYVGNVYYRGKNDPETALQYYIQSTTIEPSFNYGWYNLALCQKELGDIAGAKATVSKGLEVLNSEDGLYGILTQLEAQLSASL